MLKFKHVRISMVAFAVAAAMCTVGVSCIEQMQRQRHDQLITHGYPPAYADGFADGWSSGQQAAGALYAAFAKDVHRYLGDAEYKTGWDDGFQNGHGQFASIR